MKQVLSFVVGLLCMVFSTAYAEVPEAYYSAAEGLSGSSLKSALCGIIDNQVVNSYSFLWTMFRTSDVRADGKVWDIYSNCTFTFGTDQCGSYSQICDCYNREHIVPQSWFDEELPMKSDAFHIYPTDGKVNAMRSNYPHGNTNAAAIGDEALGSLGASSVAGYTGTVYQPADEYKGDIARTYFYFVTRYEAELPTMSGTVLTTQAYPGLTTWFLNLMLTWHSGDPVSQKEIDRNNAIYVAQQNRNPFIDYPDLVDHIWGNSKTVKWYANGNGLDYDDYILKLNIAPLPASDHIIVSGIMSNKWSYRIIHLNGNVLMQGESNGNNEITLPALADGIYILQIKENEQLYNLKLIIKQP